MTASRSLRVHSTQKQCLWYVILTRGSSHDDLLTHAPREHPGLCEWSVCCILHATPHQLLYRCSRRYRLAQVFGQTFHQLHHRSGCDGGILQAPLLSDLGERSSCMTAQSCLERRPAVIARASKTLPKLWTRAPTLLPTRHSLAASIEERHLLLPSDSPSYQHLAKGMMLAKDDRSFLYRRDMSREPHSPSADLGES